MVSWFSGWVGGDLRFREWQEIGQQLLRESLAMYLRHRSLGELDTTLTRPPGVVFVRFPPQLFLKCEMRTLVEARPRLYKAYVRSASGALGLPGTGPACEVVLLPSWAMAEPHFPEALLHLKTCSFFLCCEVLRLASRTLVRRPKWVDVSFKVKGRGVG